AIQQEDITFLITLPGIGRKTAQRMILDLKDKLDGIVIDGDKAGGNMGDAFTGDGDSASNGLSEAGSGSGSGKSSGGSLAHSWSEAKEALMALGYTEAELNKCWVAIRSKVSASDSVDVIMKLALQNLFKG